LKKANDIALTEEENQTAPCHLLLSLLKSDHPISQKLYQQGITPEKVHKLISNNDINEKMSEQSPLFFTDITSLAREGKLKPVI
jgi:ATP-dependent Clp protease ATP-binding subunit ClpA